MKVLLLQLDGKLPNLALMRIATHERERGGEVALRGIGNQAALDKTLTEGWDRVYASTIFLRTQPLAKYLKAARPDAIIGGTGWDLETTLEQYGIATEAYDYSIYPNYPHSIGFTQRGCRLKCEFCVVPKKEGAIREASGVEEIWRGAPWPKNLVLLDNDFFGSAKWRGKVETIREGGFKVSFNQGINARCLTDEAAEAIASLRYYDDDFKARRIYTAWDNRDDDARLFKGLNALIRYGVKPDHIMVYMLIGFWFGETHEDREYRRKKLRDLGCRPYPMAYITDQTPVEVARELRGYQRWVIRRADLKCPWHLFKAANYRPEKVGWLPDEKVA